MTEVLNAFRVVQLGVESTPLTPVAATRRLQTIQLQFDAAVTANPFVPQGDLMATVAPVSRDMTNCRITMQPSFGEIVYPLSSLFGAAAITTPGGGFNARQWLWNVVPTTAITPVTYTGEEGDSVEAEQLPGLVMSGLTFNIDRTRIQGSGTGFGGQLNVGATLTALTAVSDVQTVTITGTPTGGTFTLTFNGATTSAIAYNANAAAVQAALVALSTIGAGNVIVTGGPGPGTPYVVTFAGNLANQVQNVMTTSGASLTGGSSPASAVAHTTPGFSITPEPTAQVVMPNQIDLWMDASSGSFGTTQMLRGFTANWAFTDALDSFWPLNSSLPSYGGVTPKIPRPILQLTLAQDATGRGLLTAIRNGTRKYIRIKATGPIIEGSIPYSITIDMAMNVVGVGQMQSVGGIFARQFDLQFMDDAAWGRAAQITVVNTVRSLA